MPKDTPPLQLDELLPDIEMHPEWSWPCRVCGSPDPKQLKAALTRLLLLQRQEEVDAAWRRAPKDEDFKPTDPVTEYLARRKAKLQAQIEKEGQSE